jgi:hypothetical protein
MDYWSTGFLGTPLIPKSKISMKLKIANEPEHIRAHKQCMKHRQELLASEKCGCFYCLSIYSPTAIKRWIREGDGTALCPKCHIDSVIGSQSGFPITKTFLRKMHKHWFDVRDD